MTPPTAIATAERPAEGRTGSLRYLARAAAVSYLAATLLGVVMRLELVGLRTGIDFDHLLHAHSHTLYFGWAALGLLAAAGPGLGGTTATIRRATGGLVATMPLLFFGFLATGYHPFTIAVSTVVMLGWYVVAGSWWKRLSRFPTEVALAFRYGIVYLVGSSLGVWALAATQATDGSALAESLSIHAFLVGFGWFFVFAVVGAALLQRDRLGLSLHPSSVRRLLHLWAVAAWATFPLGVVGGPEVGILGPVSRVAGLMLVIPGMLWVTTLWRAADPGPNRLTHRMASLWFALATSTTAAAAAFGSDALLAGGRQGVVIHLHALFVGFVTPLLALVLYPATDSRALRSHHLGLGVMLGGLSVATVGSTRSGMWLAAAGAVVLWVAGLGWSLPILRDRTA